MFLAAVLQLTSGPDPGANWEQTAELTGRAAGYGAGFVATPEHTTILGSPEERVRTAEPLDGPGVARFAGLARSLKLNLLLGSFNERGREPGRCRNTSVLFGPDGSIRGVYRKIHLFDVNVSPSVNVRESDVVEPGDETVVVETALARVGMSVCYDLRFGALYRAMRLAGAEVICVPAAFTLTTGRDHWEPLLRARAIENQAYVLAPAQYGRHGGGSDLSESYGHAMIVDPWGLVVARASDGPGLALAEVDIHRVAKVRRAIPVADHERFSL